MTETFVAAVCHVAMVDSPPETERSSSPAVGSLGKVSISRSGSPRVPSSLDQLKGGMSRFAIRKKRSDSRCRSPHS
jgi:hypothetical protein